MQSVIETGFETVYDTQSRTYMIFAEPFLSRQVKKGSAGKVEKGIKMV